MYGLVLASCLLTAIQHEYEDVRLPKIQVIINPYHIEHRYFRIALKETDYPDETCSVLNSMEIEILEDPTYEGKPQYRIGKSAWLGFPKYVYAHRKFLVEYLRYDYECYSLDWEQSYWRVDQAIKLEKYNEEWRIYNLKQAEIMEEFRKKHDIEQGDSRIFGFKDKDGVFQQPKFLPTPKYPYYQPMHLRQPINPMENKEVVPPPPPPEEEYDEED